MRFCYLRRRLLLFLLIWLGAGRAVFGQAPAWQWATISGNGLGGASTIDAAGNVYITGFFIGSAVFGATTLISAGSHDIFVAKLTSSGAYQWAVSVGGSREEAGIGIAVDSSGNVYVSGQYKSPTLAFGTTTLTNPDIYTNCFVAKLNPAGAWEWAVNAVGAYNEYATDIVVGRGGEVIVTGNFSSLALTFGSITLTNAGSYDFFIAKLSPAGVWQWAVGGGGADADFCYSVDIDGDDNVVVHGNFRSPTLTIGTSTFTNVDYYDLFIAKLSPSGVWQWAVNVGGSGSEEGSCAVDSSGNVIIAGYFWSPTLTFGTTTLTSFGVSTNRDIYVAKLSPTGTWQWATSIGGSGDDFGACIAVDGGSGVVVTGSFRSPTLICGGTTLSNPGGYSDVFVAKLNSMGSWQWAISTGGSDDDMHASVAADGLGNVVIAGTFRSPTLTCGSTTLINPNASTRGFVPFLARLSTANGLTEDPSQTLFTLAPNPARTTVQLTGTPGAGATLLDGLGRVVSTATLNAEGTAALDVRGLPAGLYLVRVGGSRARRLVVE